MASNSRIASRFLDHQCTTLRLTGDSDGSSAWGRINTLDENTKTFPKIAINTDGLRAIQAFGRDVFRSKMSGLNGARAKTQVTGRLREIFGDT